MLVINRNLGIRYGIGDILSIGIHFGIIKFFANGIGS